MLQSCHSTLTLDQWNPLLMYKHSFQALLLRCDLMLTHHHHQCLVCGSHTHICIYIPPFSMALVPHDCRQRACTLTSGWVSGSASHPSTSRAHGSTWASTSAWVCCTHAAPSPGERSSHLCRVDRLPWEQTCSGFAIACLHIVVVRSFLAQHNTSSHVLELQQLKWKVLSQKAMSMFIHSICISPCHHKPSPLPALLALPCTPHPSIAEPRCPTPLPHTGPSASCTSA